MNTITGTVTATQRLGHTYYGNPIKSVYIEAGDDSGWYRVSNNANLVYSIENPEYRDTTHTFELTKAGRLSGRVTPAN